MDRSTGEPLSNSTVELSIQNDTMVRTIARGRTNADGEYVRQFEAPETNGSYQLRAQSESGLGSDTVSTGLQVKRSYALHLDTDKPVYQPGQDIAVRSLIRRQNGEPIQDASRLTVSNPQGQTVLSRRVSSNAFGMLNRTVPLSPEAPTGRYRIEVEYRGQTRATTVSVSDYQTPQFDISFRPGKSYYQPGETLSATVSAEYFFGKPVRNATVSVVGAGYIGDMKQFGTANTTTDSSGLATIDLELPRYFAGLPEHSGKGLVVLNVSVTDPAGHSETVTRRISVAEEDLLLNAFTATGSLAKGVENTVYITAKTPDRNPVETNVSFGEGRSVRTNNQGVAKTTIVPESQRDRRLELQATTEGLSGSKTVYFELDRGNRLALQTANASYKIGDSIEGEVLVGSSTGRVYIDVVNARRTVLTKSITVEGGRAAFSVPVTPSMEGSTTVRAWAIFENNRVGSTARQVLVRPATNLDVHVEADRKRYRPGQNATLRLTTKRDGSRVPAAVGLDIVDESVLALEEERPGLAALHYRLERELRRPQLFVHPNKSTARAPSTEGEAVAAKASIARLSTSAETTSANSFEEKRAAIERRKSAHRRLNGTLLNVILLILPAGVLVSAAIHNRKHRLLSRLGRSAVSTIGGIMTGVLVLATTGVILLGIASTLPSALPALALIAVVALLIGFVSLLHRWSFRSSTPRSFQRDIGLLAGLYIGLIVLSVGLAGAIDFSPITPWIPMHVGAALVFPIGFVAAADDPGARLHRGFVLGLVLSLAINPAIIGAFVLEIGDQQEAAPNTSFSLSGGSTTGLASNGQPSSDGSQTTENTNIDVRQHFPETLASETVLTGPDGTATLDLQMADSITTWRVSALASDQSGAIGTNRSSLQVFQSFFVKPSLPRTLTQRDQVTIPVSVFNYGNESRTVRLRLRSAPWFEAEDRTENVTVPQNTVRQASFTIKATRNGEQALTLIARGTNKAGDTTIDAIRKRVTVEPYGRRVSADRSGVVSGETTTPLPVPERSVPGSSKTVLRLYPGAYGQVVSGLDALLSMPNGCFEQTSSSLYPNVLALQYMERTGQTNPEIRMAAERYITTGYQRLLTFETSTQGGYSLFGNDPPNLLLTAYGYQEMADMNEVYPVDRSVLSDMRSYIASKQDADGSWPGSGRLEYPLGVAGDRLSTTAYVTWSLAHGASDRSAVHDGARYIRDHLTVQEARTSTLAISLNALVRANRYPEFQRKIATELESRAIDGGGSVHWRRGGSHDGADEEADIRYGNKPVLTTALVTNAFVTGGFHPDTADRALDWLVGQKSGQGGWGSTQNTVMTLKALTNAASQTEAVPHGTVHVQIDDETVATHQVDAKTDDEIQTIVLPTDTGRNEITITGPRNSGIYYELQHQFNVPWNRSDLPNSERNSSLRMMVSHDRRNLTVDDTVTTRVTVNAKDGAIGTALVDIGVPPGFVVQESSLDRLKRNGTISRYERRGRQLILYVEDVEGRRTLSFKMRATQPVEASSGAARMYDYYNPNTEAISAPVRFHVRAG
jgi:uncharacterized protein YfaS (alpha-2-macroglobulin family)